MRFAALGLGRGSVCFRCPTAGPLKGPHHWYAGVAKQRQNGGGGPVPKSAPPPPPPLFSSGAPESQKPQQIGGTNRQIPKSLVPMRRYACPNGRSAAAPPTGADPRIRRSCRMRWTHASGHALFTRRPIGSMPRLRGRRPPPCGPAQFRGPGGRGPCRFRGPRQTRRPDGQ